MAPMFRITGAICVLLMVPLVIGNSITYNMSFAGDIFLVIISCSLVVWEWLLVLVIQVILML